MNPVTGEIRELAEGEVAKRDEIPLTDEEARKLLEFRPEQRMDRFQQGVGKDRRAAHRGQQAKAKAKRRARR